MDPILSNLPNGWFNDSYLQQLEHQLPIWRVIPFGAEDPNRKMQAIHAFIYQHDNNLYLAGNYDSTNGWTDLYSFPLEQQPIFSYDSIWNRALWCIGDNDTVKLRELEETLHNHIKKQFGGIPIPTEEEFERVKQIQQNAQNNCNCDKSNNLLRSKVEVEASEALEINHLFCSRCRRHHAIERAGKQISDSTLFDPNWILENTYDDVFAIPDTDDYVIYDTDDDVKRIDYTVDALAWIGGSRSREFTNYDPEIQNTLIYVHKDEVSGYLSVRKIENYDILHQLYIRPSMRKKGFATDLVEAWNEHVRETDTYLLDEPNEASLSIIRKRGHLNTDSIPQALPASRIESLRLHD